LEDLPSVPRRRETNGKKPGIPGAPVRPRLRIVLFQGVNRRTRSKKGRSVGERGAGVNIMS